MEKPFQSLTKQDLKYLWEKGKIKNLQEGEIILEEGSRRKAMYIILVGSARVETTHLGEGITIASLGKWEVFGEISFLEGTPASASVIAEEPTTVVMLDGMTINSLLCSVPGLATRFYQSLAIIVSRRLRETSALIPFLMIEDVAQVQRSRPTHFGLSNTNQLPPSLMKAIDAFKNAMMKAEMSIIKQNSDKEQVHLLISDACQKMNDSLRVHVEREESLAKTVGVTVFRETFPFFMSSRFLDRCFTKPRGFAGDFETINQIYDNDPHGEGRLGYYIDNWSLEIPACKAVRERRHFMKKFIHQKINDFDKESIPIATLACGPAREMFDIFEENFDLEVQYTCVDIDHLALGLVSKKMKEKRLEQNIRIFKENIVRMSLGKGKITVPPQAIIYSLGLIDYLQDKLVIKLLDWIFNNLSPGGYSVLGNFNKGNPDKPFMDYVVEWVLIHRSPEDLKEIYSKSKFGSRVVTISTDETGVQLFASCQKS